MTALTVQSVDTLLRARSDDRLKDQIEALMAPITALVASAGMGGDDATAQAIQQFGQTLFAACALGAQQNEIAAFLSTTEVTSFVDAS